MRRCAVVGLFLVVLAGLASAQVVPLERAHAHNDYVHARPLLDALDHGFCSVEADIHLVDGQLLVGHDLKDVKPEKSLQALYLDPLRQRVAENGGHVYRGADARFWLLIDFKTESEPTWAALRAVLEQYSDMLTRYEGDNVKIGAVSIVVDNADEQIKAERVRYAAIDGKLADLDLNVPTVLTPWVSAPWSSVFTWKGDGPMPADELKKLRELVAQCHAQEKKIRFWALPPREIVWRTVYDAGVDFLNADNLGRMQKFLLKNKRAR